MGSDTPDTIPADDSPRTLDARFGPRQRVELPVSFSRSVLELVEAAARKREMPVAQFIAEAVIAFIAESPPPPEPSPAPRALDPLRTVRIVGG